ncbi:50S ribosomal protein L17 [Candidatus Omnitrophota bacterium]
MRHQKRSKRLGRQRGHRVATLRNLVISLFKYQRIKTTKTKAQLARSFAERLITLGKKGTLHSRRQAQRLLVNKSAVRELFSQIVPLFKAKTSGFTRIIRYTNRSGDGAELVFLELTQRSTPAKPTKKAKPKSAKEATPAAEQQEPVKPAEKPRSDAAPKLAERAKPAKEPQATKPKPKEKPGPPQKKSKPTKELKPKKFLGGLRKLFKKERDSL